MVCFEFILKLSSGHMVILDPSGCIFIDIVILLCLIDVLSLDDISPWWDAMGNCGAFVDCIFFIKCIYVC